MYVIKVRKPCGKTFDTGVPYCEAAAIKKAASFQRLYKDSEVFYSRLDNR